MSAPTTFTVGAWRVEVTDTDSAEYGYDHAGRVLYAAPDVPFGEVLERAVELDLFSRLAETAGEVAA